MSFCVQLHQTPSLPLGIYRESCTETICSHKHNNYIILPRSQDDLLLAVAVGKRVLFTGRKEKEVTGVCFVHCCSNGSTSLIPRPEKDVENGLVSIVCAGT